MITHWNCQICKEKRPDAKISVVSYLMKILPGAQVNIKYCNDNSECLEAASKKGEEEGGRYV